jgi:hypothetical protein
MKISSRNMLVILAGYILTLLLIMSVYHARRISGVNKMKSELNRVRGEITAINKSLSEAEKYRKGLKPGLQTMAYIESLYRIADDNHLSFHEVTTGNAPATSTTGGEKGTAFASSRLKITIKGDFRSVAEYVRTILNQQQFSRITELKIASDQNNVVGNIYIELFSFR